MRKTILIVEDDKSLRDFLEKTLANHNFNVMVAEDGAEAVEMVEKKLPDLVILDLGLPKVSGETVCIEIKKNHPEVIVIVLTAKSKSTDAVRSLQIGADDYMSKPFEIEELLARIGARLRTNEEEKPAPSKTTLPELNTITFRESVVLIGIRLIMTELIFGFLFFLSVALISFLDQYLNFENPFPLSLILLVILLIVNMKIIFSIILKWHFEYVEITRNAIIKHKGIFYKKEETFACNFIETITLSQDFFGMIFNYGTLELFDPALKDPIYIFNIASPKKYSEVIKKIFSKKKDSSAIFISQKIKSNDVSSSL
ncbi:MAG: response regulator transcription factor [Patescibacteria group bacterium]